MRWIRVKLKTIPAAGWILAAVVAFTSTPARALSYSLDKDKLIHPPLLEAYRLARYFEPFGFRSLSDRSIARPGLPFDTVFISDRWDRSFALKAGIVVPADHEGKLRFKNSLQRGVFHFRFHGVPYAFVSTGISQAELKRLLRPWIKGGPYVRLPLLVLPERAWAEEDCRPGPLTRTKQMASDLVTGIESPLLLRRIGQCASDAWGGMARSAAGTFAYFKQLITHPTSLWEEMSKGQQELKEFAFRIRSELSEVFSSLSGLSTGHRLQLGCSAAGEVVMAALEAAAAGALVGAMMPVILSRLKSIVAFLKKLKGLDKLGFPSETRYRMAREVISCAS